MNAQEKIKAVFVLPAMTAGGAERVLITLANTLDNIEYTPTFVTVSDEGPMRPAIASNIPFHSLSSNRVSLSLPKLYFKLKELQPDIVISTMAHMNFIILILKPLFPKTRFIVREAITPSFIFNQHPRLAFLIKKAYQILYPLADRVISPAQIIIDEFKLDLGMSCKNHVLLHNPVDHDCIRAQEDEPLQQGEERHEGRVHFIAAGRLHYQKGFDQLLNALSDMNPDYDWVLTILGEGPERQNLERLVKEKGLDGKIQLPGLSDNPWPHYAAADCFLMPSRWEGLPNVVLESLACGTPVIATKESGGIDEISRHASSGAVTVVAGMSNFINAMQKVRPKSSKVFGPSLLPDNFSRENVRLQFSEILGSITS